MKKKTRPMNVSENFHTAVYKWGVQNNHGINARQITDRLAIKLENELNENKPKKKKAFQW